MRLPTVTRRRPGGKCHVDNELSRFAIPPYHHPMKPAELNPARVDFVTLRLFCAVARTGSISKGAAQCHIATSAASRRLSDFEASARTRLLERGPSGVTLTPAGHVALQHAMRLFQGFEQFSGELRDYSRGAKGHVRLWANMSSLTEFLPAALSGFLRDHPEIRIDVEEQLSGDIVRAVIDDLADIGVFSESAPAHGLEVIDWRVDQLVLVCPRDHPLARLRKTGFASCLQYDFVGLNRGSALLEITSLAAAQAAQRLRLRVQVRSFDAMCQMIGSGLGIGVLPLGACQAHLAAMKLKAVTLTDAWATRRLLIGVRSRETLAPAARSLLEHLAAG
jgi:DNA-binding transcriptional LysR family regulator